MKKLIATLFALMLVASIMPGVFAERGSGKLGLETEVRLESEDSDDSSETEVETETEVESESTDDSTDSEVRMRTRTEFKDGMLRIREEYQEGSLRIRQEFKASGFADLTVEERKELLESLKERRKELMENRQQALIEIREEIREDHARIKELRGKYSEEREDFVKARDELKTKCSNGRSEECKQARQELNTEASEFMGNAAEQMLRIIETMKVRVEANENIDNETAAAVLAQLDTRADAIVAAQAKIDALDNSTDLNATKAAAAELREAWSEARVTIRLTEGLLVHARYAEFISHLEQMETRFSEARTKLAAEGKDVTQLDADLASFGAKIDAAAEGYAAAEDSYITAMANATTEAQANELLKSTRAQLKASHEDLQDARNDLRAVLKDIRSLSTDVLRETAAKVQADSEESASVEAEVEVETEVEA